MIIGIIGAMDYETALLKENMQVERQESLSGLTFIVGQLRGKQAIVVTCGIGKVNAAVCTQILLTHFKADHIINTGVAGAIEDCLDVGDLVVSTDLVEHDMDATGFGYQFGQIPGMQEWVFKADPVLVESAYAAAMAEVRNHKTYKGRIVTGDQFVSSAERKQFLQNNFSPFATEMEGGAIAHACFLSGVPFVVIRAMSDKADGSAHVSYEDFSREAAQNSCHIVMHMLERL